MRSWSKASPEDFQRLELEAHRILEGVPLHDVWRVSLSGGGSGRTISDVRDVMAFETLADINPIVRFLFGLRSRLGKLFGWDAPRQGMSDSSELERVPSELRERSTLPPGSADGPFIVLYALEQEAVSAIRNATVHAFSVLALEPTPSGYHLFWAIFVEPVAPLTGAYMALIAPFRRFLVYPAILSHVHRRWAERFGGEVAHE